MAEVSKIGPSDFESSRPVFKIAPEDFEAEKPVPPPSVMDPNQGTDTLKRIGRFVRDPKQTVPLAVGAATAGTAMLATDDAPLALKLGLSAAGGFAAPYTEAAASKAMGGNPETPSVWDALKSAGMNMAFEGASVKAPKMVEGAQAVSQLPKGEQTLANLTQQVKNTGFLKSLGLNDDQIAQAMKDPEGTARSLKASIDQGNRVADTFKGVVDNERANFKTQYDSVLGERAKAPVDAKSIAAQMRQLAGGQTQHELSPTFQKFLMRKADEIDPPASMPKDPLALGGGKKPIPLDPVRDKNLLDQMRKQGLLPEQEAKPFTAQDARDLNTELHENVPGQATNLDKKAAATLNDTIKTQYEDALRKNGATEAQIGQLHGIDQDYAMFQKTINGLRPDRADFGEQTADAFFQTAKTNPTLALNFARMAEDAGKMPEFRDAFLKQVTQEMRGAEGGPINQMKALQKLQTSWRGTNDGKAVLSAVFGKDSPMANPVEMSKFLGAMNQPAVQDAMSQTGRQMGRVGFTGRQLLLMGALGGGSLYALRDHPEKIPAAMAAIATLAVAGPIMTRLSSGGQRAMIKMLATPSPETVNGFFRVAGPALTAGFSQPSDLSSETPKP